MQGSVENGIVRSSNPSPHKTRSPINIEGVKIFTAPRKLIRSLQDPDGKISDFSERQTRRFGSPFSSKFEWTPTSKHEQNGLAQGMNCNIERGENFSSGGEQFHGKSESVSSTGDVLHSQVSPEVVCGNQTESQSANIQKGHRKLCYEIVILFLLGFDNQNYSYVLVPTYPVLLKLVIRSISKTLDDSLRCYTQDLCTFSNQKCLSKAISSDTSGVLLFSLYWPISVDAAYVRKLKFKIFTS